MCFSVLFRIFRFRACQKCNKRNNPDSSSFHRSRFTHLGDAQRPSFIATFGCRLQPSQGREPTGRASMARPATRGCICECGVRRNARAQAIIARVAQCPERRPRQGRFQKAHIGIDRSSRTGRPLRRAALVLETRPARPSDSGKPAAAIGAARAASDAFRGGTTPMGRARL